MKTIEQIIENQNHARLTSALNERVAEIAEKVRILLNQLEITGIFDYTICKNKANCGYTEEYLAVEKADPYYEDVSGYFSLETSKEYMYCGDFNCRTHPASNSQKLAFLNKAKEIFETLDKWKEEECADIEKALTETETL